MLPTDGKAGVTFIETISMRKMKDHISRWGWEQVGEDIAQRVGLWTAGLDLVTTVRPGAIQRRRGKACTNPCLRGVDEQQQGARVANSIWSPVLRRHRVQDVVPLKQR